MKLTLGSVREAELPKGKADHIFWDDDLPGFGLRVREGGSRNYVVQYKVGKKTRRMVIGPVERLAPDQARKAAKRELGKVSLGQDPQGEKAAAKAKDAATDTFAVLAVRFMEFQAGHLRKPNLYSTDLYLLKHCRRLHGLKLDVITRREVASCCQPSLRTTATCRLIGRGRPCQPCSHGPCAMGFATLTLSSARTSTPEPRRASGSSRTASL